MYTLSNDNVIGWEKLFIYIERSKIRLTLIHIYEYYSILYIWNGQL